jgi:hypothetical protein
LLEQITDEMATKLGDAHNEVLKQLAKISGANTNQSPTEIKHWMEQRGYEISNYAENQHTYFSLHHKDKVIIIGEVWCEFESVNANLSIKMKLTPKNS